MPIPIAAAIASANTPIVERTRMGSTSTVCPRTPGAVGAPAAVETGGATRPGGRAALRLSPPRASRWRARSADLAPRRSVVMSRPARGARSGQSVCASVPPTRRSGSVRRDRPRAGAPTLAPRGPPSRCAMGERFGLPERPSVVAVSEPYWRGAVEDEAMQEEHGFLWRALLDTIDIDLAGRRVADAGGNRGGVLRLLVDESGIGEGYGYDPASGAIH